MRSDIGVPRGARRQEEQRILLPHRVRVVDLAEQLIRIGKLRFELVAHLFADGIAAGPDGGPHRRHQVLRPRSVAEPHGPDTALDDALQRPAPTRVECRHCAPPHVGHQHGDAVRHLDCEHHAGRVGHHSIAAQQGATIRRLEPVIGRVDGFHGPDESGMDLPQGDQARGRPTRELAQDDLAQEPAAIAGHIRRVILLGPSQIQRALAVNGRDTARASAEPMAEPRILLPTHRAHHRDHLPRRLARLFWGFQRRFGCPRQPLALLPGACAGLAAAVVQPNLRQQLIDLCNRFRTLGPIHNSLISRAISTADFHHRPQKDAFPGRPSVLLRRL